MQVKARRCMLPAYPKIARRVHVALLLLRVALRSRSCSRAEPSRLLRCRGRLRDRMCAIAS
jgi:hypothetical protein